METTVGQVIINDMLPEDMRDYNRVWDKKTKGKVLTDLARRHPEQFKEVSHNLLRFGAKAAYETGGQSFGIEDIAPTQISRDFQRVMGQELQNILARAYKRGKTSQDPEVQQEIADAAIPWMKKIDDGINEELGWENPFYRQAYGTGAQKPGTLRSIVGADVFYVDQNNKRVPIPVTHGYAQGLTPAEYFIQSFGTRKGMVDLQKATQDAGFLSKQLVQIAHRLVVTDKDDDTAFNPDMPTGYPVDTDDADNEGSCLAEDIGGYKRNTLLTPKILGDLKNQGINRILIRSVMVGGPANGGVYANDCGVRESGSLPNKGDFVGINAVQAISEPLTQGAISCLDPETEVRMANFTIKKLKDIKVGDKVLGASKEGRAFPVKVTNVFNNGLQPVYKISYKQPDYPWKRVIIQATMEHKILQVKDIEHPELRVAPIGIGAKAPAAVVYRVSGANELYAKEDAIFLGEKETLDIEVDCEDHLFVLANGMIVSNSKHSGGVAGADSGKAISGFKYVNQLIQVPKHFPGGAVHSEIDGIVSKIEDAPQGGKYIYIGGEKHYVGRDNEKDIPITVKVGDRVEAGDVLTEGIPNPAMIVKYKGIGEGRRYFTSMFRDALNNAGTPIHRRNIEMLSRGLINYIKLTSEVGDYAPDDILPYSMIERDYQPREDSRTDNPELLEGQYLEQPVLHYSIGTKLRPSVIKELKEFGIKRVCANQNPPPFEPEMVRGMAHVSKDPDWATRLLGAYNKDSLLEGARRGATSSAESTSYVPAITFGEGAFGHIGPLKQGSVKLADAITTPAIDLTPSPIENTSIPDLSNVTVDPSMGNMQTGATPQTPEKPSFLSQKAHDFANTQIHNAVDKGTDVATQALYNVLHDAAGGYIHSQEFQDALNNSNIPGIYSALKEDMLPALNGVVNSSIFNPLKAGVLHYGLNSTAEERGTLPYSLGRIMQGQLIDPMYPHASPFSWTPVPRYSPSSFLGQNENTNGVINDSYSWVRWLAKRLAHPTTAVWDTGKGLNALENAGWIEPNPVLRWINNNFDVQNSAPEDYIHIGANAINATRQIGETALKWTSDIPGVNPPQIISDGLDYLSTGVPHGLGGHAYNAAPIALYAAPRYFAHSGAQLLAKDAPAGINNLYSLLSMQGVPEEYLTPIIDSKSGLVLYNPALPAFSKRVFSPNWVNNTFSSGAKYLGKGLKGLSYATDAYLADEITRDMETQTNINGNSNYDAIRNLYTAPYDVLQQGKTKPGKGSVIIGTDTFGNREIGTHSYGPTSLFSTKPWANNSEYKKQRKHLEQMRQENPDNENGIPYDLFDEQPVLPIYTEKGNYVLAIPPRSRTWGEYAEDWKKWWNGEPITLRPDQRWTIPVAANGNPVPARMPEKEDDPIINILDKIGLHGLSTDRKADARDYGAQIKRINGILSRRPMFPQLNKAWDNLIQKQRELKERQNSIVNDIFITGSNWASESNVPLVKKLSNIANEWEHLANEVDGLYMLEDYYQYQANPEKYEWVYSPLPWEQYVESRTEEERKRLPKDMVAAWKQGAIPVRREKMIQKAVEDAVTGWFASGDPKIVLSNVKGRLMDLRRYRPIPFTEEDINNLSTKDIIRYIPSDKLRLDPPNPWAPPSPTLQAPTFNGQGTQQIF